MGEAYKLSPGIYRNKALGLFGSALWVVRGILSPEVIFDELQINHRRYLVFIT